MTTNPAHAQAVAEIEGVVGDLTLPRARPASRALIDKATQMLRNAAEDLLREHGVRVSDHRWPEDGATSRNPDMQEYARIWSWIAKWGEGQAPMLGD